MPDEPIWPAPSGAASGGSGLGTAWVDMCSPPYSHVPGDNVYADLQAAINAANSANQDTTIFFSKPGVYNISGALQSGSGTIGGAAYTYSGQVVFPGRHWAQGKIAIRIAGVTPAAGFNDGLASREPSPTGGVVLQTNTATGWMFDAIPIDNVYSAGLPATDIHVIFANITLRSPSNPQGAGCVNGLNVASMSFEGRGGIDTTNSSNVTMTGTGIGIQMPPFSNMAVSQLGGGWQVFGWPVGVAHSEHFVLGAGVLISQCNTAIQPQGGSGHVAVYERVCVSGVKNVIVPAGSNKQLIRGLIDIGDAGGGQSFVNIINDPNNLLAGVVTVEEWGNATDPEPGFPTVGAANLQLAPFLRQRSDWPSDNFTRLTQNFSNGAYIGASSGNHDIWQLGSGTTQASFAITAGVLKATQSAQAWITHRQPRSAISRVVRTIFTPTGGTYNCYQVLSRAISGAKAGNFLSVSISGGTVVILKQLSGVNTTLATSAGGVIVAGTTYTVDTVISNPVNGPYVVSVYLNGASSPTVTYTLTSTDITDVADIERFRISDGFGFFSDTVSGLSLFAVMPPN